MSLGQLSSSATVTAVKRRVYLIGLPFAVACSVLLFWLEAGQGALHLADYIGLPLLTSLKLTLWVFFWQRRGKFYVLELLLFSGVSLLLLSSLAYTIFELSVGSIGNLASIGYWTSVLYTLAFLIFGVRYGLKLSLAVYLLALSVWLGGVAGGVNPSEQSLLFQLFVANGLLLLLLYSFGVLIEEQARQAAAHKQEANTDLLTGLPNRRFLQAQLEGEFERAARYQRTFSVVMLDIDGFKGLNDSFGHPVGDRILQEVAELLRTQARTLDTVGRWGGEEFLLLLPELPLARACEVAERFRVLIGEHSFAHGGPVTASLGVAELSEQETLSELLTRVDRTLYDAKAGGRNRVMPGNLDQALY